MKHKHRFRMNLSKLKSALGGIEMLDISVYYVTHAWLKSALGGIEMPLLESCPLLHAS